MLCDTPDILFPMKADLFFANIKQTEYGQVSKDWIFDRTVVCNATPVGGLGEEDMKPATFLQYENKLIARTKTDIRISSQKSKNAVPNILMTNIRDRGDNLIYLETSGPRSGRGTIYEIATVEPFTNGFGDVEYYKIVLRRAENQSVGD